MRGCWFFVPAARRSRLRAFLFVRKRMIDMVEWQRIAFVDSRKRQARESQRQVIVAPAAIGVLGIIVAWQLLVWIGDYPAFILPEPAAVFRKFAETITNGLLWRHLRLTLLEVLLGFALGFSSATALGYYLAHHQRAEHMVTPYLVAMQAVPVVAIAPLLVIWFGFGLLSKVLICALIVFFPVLINTIVGVRSVRREWLDMMHVWHASRWETFRLVEVPAALPVLFGGLKLGVTLAVVGAVVGEFVGAREGLGALINIARGGLYDTTLLFVALFTLVAMALALYGSVVWLEQRVRWW